MKESEEDKQEQDGTQEEKIWRRDGRKRRL